MKKLFFVFLIIIFFGELNVAHAEDLLGLDCFSEYQGFSQISGTSSVMGMSCEKMEALNSRMELVGVGIWTLQTIFTYGGVTEQVASHLAALGVTFANPVVLSIAAAGVAGAASFYVVMNISLEDCQKKDQEELRLSILQEIERKYGISTKGNEPLRLHTN